MTFNIINMVSFYFLFFFSFFFKDINFSPAYTYFYFLFCLVFTGSFSLSLSFFFFLEIRYNCWRYWVLLVLIFQQGYYHNFQFSFQGEGLSVPSNIGRTTFLN